MILTPIDQQALPHILDVFSTGLGAHAMAQAVFQRIAATRRYFSDPTADLAAGRTKAVALAAKFNISTLDEEPTVAVNGGAKLVHPGGAKLVHLTLCGTRCWGVVPVVHRRDPRCFV